MSEQKPHIRLRMRVSMQPKDSEAGRSVYSQSEILSTLAFGKVNPESGLFLEKVY